MHVLCGSFMFPAWEPLQIVKHIDETMSPLGSFQCFFNKVLLYSHNPLPYYTLRPSKKSKLHVTFWILKVHVFKFFEVNEKKYLKALLKAHFCSEAFRTNILLWLNSASIYVGCWLKHKSCIKGNCSKQIKRAAAAVRPSCLGLKAFALWLCWSSFCYCRSNGPVV